MEKAVQEGSRRGGDVGGVMPLLSSIPQSTCASPPSRDEIYFRHRPLFC
jgi:hypothetical protein